MKALFFFSFFILCSSVSFAQIDKALLEQAEAGDSDAQYNVGLQYEKGLNVEKSYMKAAEWYAKAAELELYKIAAESGIPHAQHMTGIMLYNDKKYEEAFGWAE